MRQQVSKRTKLDYMIAGRAKFGTDKVLRKRYNYLICCWVPDISAEN